MISPLIHRRRSGTSPISKERGFTMALVAVGLVSIIAMAALSIDVGTLYQAKAEAQRAADAAALTAARVISISGVTGDPSNPSSWQKVCGGEQSPASVAAINIAQRNTIAGNPASTVKVYYGTRSGVGTNEDCSAANSSIGINPVVQVYVQQAKLPTFFARIFSMMPGGTSSNSGVSATATAEAFNPSNSQSLAGSVIPVQPRCVKPWIIPNVDPIHLSKSGFVSLTTGDINAKGIYASDNGVIGESFNINADCAPGGNNCHGPNLMHNPPQWNPLNQNGSGNYLEYLPALISGNAGATPSCSPTTGFQAAIAGCDQTTVYACGTLNGAQADLSENPVNPDGPTGDTATAISCLTQSTQGADTLVTAAFPFQIQAGAGNPLAQLGIVNGGDTITTSNSIATMPIYDSTNKLVRVKGQAHPDVTIVGFLQVFINSVDGAGNVNVTVLNVAGCSNDATNTGVSGSSPVPVRLITQPSSGP